MVDGTTVTLRCPECGAAHREQMPADACVYFYECGQCGVLLRPRHGDCCVFCSYGDRRCPSRQGEASSDR